MKRMLDNQSQGFIKYALHELDGLNMPKVIEEARNDFIAFWRDTPIDELLKLAKEKMIKGALEHGSPDPNRDYQKELQDEYLDLVLWGLMKKWIKERNFKVIDGGYYCTKHGLKNCLECGGIDE